MSTDGPAQRSPRLAPGRHRGGRRGAATSMPRSHGVLDAAHGRARDRRWARSSSRTPTGRPPARGHRRPGRAVGRAARPTEVADPAHPFARGRRSAGRDLRSRGDDGRRLRVRRRLPAARSSRAGGVEVAARLDRLRLAGAARPRRGRARDADRARGAGRRRGRPRPARLDRGGALRVVRADGPHRPADRSRQRADGRPDPRARAGPRRPAGQRGLARDVRRRRLPGDEPRAAATRPATTSCAGSRRSSPSRSGWSTRSGGSAATSSCWSRPARPG